jgi:hypothetical protein
MKPSEESDAMFPVNQIFALARNYAPGHESAILAYLDAMNLRDQGMLKEASRRALVSLKHSIGILHPVYKQATEMFDRVH